MTHEPKWTPGPWFKMNYATQGESNVRGIFSQEKGHPANQICRMISGTKDDARLLAAAPDLYAALKLLLDDVQTLGEQWRDSDDGPATKPAGFELPVSEEAWNAARAALAKAEGRTEQ